MMSSTHRIAAGGTHYNGYVTTRPVVLGLAKVLFSSLFQISSVSAMPLWTFVGLENHEDDGPMPSGDPTFWLYIGIAAILVLTGGAFAGLTIALMGQDGVHLQVLIASGDGREQRHAEKVLQLLKRGKHWVLVTLLLSNTIVNETLPIILDRSLGGGWPAVVGSTGLIVIFGEVIPQSVCVRYGLSIGAFMVPFVGALMWILCPIAWPVAKLLDFALGEDDHGVVYKKPGLKTLVNLHQTLGKVPTERLNQDEVTIITAVLDLKGKPVGDIMTPMDDVFTMSADEVLNEETIDKILRAGYSRIPIYEPSNEQNFVGMLLVKILITYDPEDCKKVGDFALATLPETRPETSCLDIINFFQEGKSHMVLVSEFPGENYGAIGVVTLEDVIEELIGEEIIDESDVFIDVHKAIRRMAPAPKARVTKSQVVESTESQVPRPSDDLIDLTDGSTTTIPQSMVAHGNNRNDSPVVFATSPKTTFMRRSSSTADGNIVPVRGNVSDMRDHLKHLGPSNLASRPKTTRYQTVKIKPAHNLVRTESRTESDINRRNSIQEVYEDFPAAHGGEGEGLLKSAGKDASDGVQALQQGYGSTNLSTSPNRLSKLEQGDNYPKSRTGSTRSGVISEGSSDTLGSMNSRHNSPPYIKKKGTARSGSITENIIEAGGVRKVVLETNSSSSDDKDERSKENSPPLKTTSSQGEADEFHNNGESTSQKNEEVKKKRRRIRKKKGAKAGEASGAGSAHGDE